jgi:hypothetical protein
MLDRAPIYRSYSRLLSIASAFLAVGLTCSDVAHASSDRFARVAIEDGGQHETLSGAEADSHVSGDISGSERGSSDGERASGAEHGSSGGATSGSENGPSGGEVSTGSDHGSTGGETSGAGSSGGEGSSGSDQGSSAGGTSGSDQGSSSGGEGSSGSDQGSSAGGTPGSDQGSSSGGEGSSGSDQGSSAGGTSGSDQGSTGGSATGGVVDTNKRSESLPTGGGTVTAPIEIVRDAVGAEYTTHDIVVLASDVDADTIHGDAFTVVKQEALLGLGGALLTLRVPQAQDAISVLSALRTSVPRAASDLDHVYRLAKSAAGSLAAPSRKHPAANLRGTVGLIDAPVDSEYPTVRVAIVESRTFSSGPSGDLSHGTATAELVADHGANVLVASVFADDAHGNPAATAASIISAMDWLVTRGVTVINLSLTGPQNRALSEAIRRAQSVGCIIVAAAGNEGPAAPAVYPAADAGVVAVTAVDRANQAYRYANRGSYIRFSALGVDVDTPLPPHARRAMSGTSFAAPVVAATIARSVERRTAEDSAKLVQWFETHAKDLGDPGRDPVFGFGLLVPKN